MNDITKIQLTRAVVAELRKWWAGDSFTLLPDGKTILVNADTIAYLDEERIKAGETYAEIITRLTAPGEATF